MSIYYHLNVVLQYLQTKVEGLQQGTKEHLLISGTILYINYHVKNLKKVPNPAVPFNRYAYPLIIHFTESLKYFNIIETLIHPLNQQWSHLQITIHALSSFCKTYDLSVLSEEDFFFYLMSK